MTVALIIGGVSSAIVLSFGALGIAIAAWRDVTKLRSEISSMLNPASTGRHASKPADRQRRHVDTRPTPSRRLL